MTIKLIIGLRNPGSAYEHTRHNAGAWLVEALAQRNSVKFKLEKKLHTEVAGLELNNQACRLLLPTTFMNQSGLPTREAAQFYRITPDEILIVHDELDLPTGRMKLKTGGGHGGHNGLRSIIASLGSSDFHRLRVGIGHPGHKDLVHNYVLGKPGQSDRQLMHDAIDRAIAVMPTIICGDLAAAMNTLNS
ncbi:aminoacyl-tRNA hydrolase [Legionella dresdenensis]|uniref:Peptidyl-tRNA hydrolase n=1 Tax=Legionella dresdenensis TaxID=450200 RepID=A0ABV8CGY9_9GAMM